MRVKEIDIPIYGGTVMFIFTDNLEEVNLEYNLGDNLNDFEGVVFNNNDKDYFYLATTSKSARVNVHEIIHLVNDIFKSRSIKLDLDNDEPYAYMAGWIASELEKFLIEL
jgi:hypothetical protein